MCCTETCWSERWWKDCETPTLTTKRTAAATAETSRRKSPPTQTIQRTSSQPTNPQKHTYVSPHKCYEEQLPPAMLAVCRFSFKKKINVEIFRVSSFFLLSFWHFFTPFFVENVFWKFIKIRVLRKKLHRTLQKIYNHPYLWKGKKERFFASHVHFSYVRIHLLF